MTDFKCLYHADIQSRIETLHDRIETHEKLTSHPGVTERLSDHDRRLNRHEETMDKIFVDLREIHDKLLGRPSWTVTVIIGTLLTALGWMISIAWQAHLQLLRP